MARLGDRKLVLVQIRISPEQRRRLEHHARRLGVNMVEIARDGLLARLDQLDEKELVAREARLARDRQGAFVPTVVQHKRGRPPGLGDRNRRNQKSNVTVPDKLRRSFRRYAESLETAKDKSEAVRRAQTILDDIRERTSSPEDAAAVHRALDDFMKDRRAARARPSDLIELSADVPISGDADD